MVLATIGGSMALKFLGPLLIDAGAPILGKALGMPQLAGPASDLLKTALGLGPGAGPSEVLQQMERNPGAIEQAEEQARTNQWDAIVAEEETRRLQSTHIHEQIMSEMGKVGFWHWRHQLGYAILFYIYVAIVGMLFVILGKFTVIDYAALMSATTMWSLGAFALVGFIARDTTQRTTTAVTGVPPTVDVLGGVIGKVLNRR